MGTLVVNNQLELLKNRKLGYGDDKILIVELADRNLWNSSTSFLNYFAQNPDIVSSSTIMGAPGDPGMMGNQNAWAEGMEPNENIFLPLYAGDESILETLGLEMVEGRNFSNGIMNGDSARYIIVNESAVKQFGWTESVGKKMIISGDEWTVLGVVKDFHFLSLHQSIGPLGIQLQYNNYLLALRINKHKIPETLSFIEEQWKNIDPSRPMSSFFISENFQRQYTNEARLNKILTILMVLSIVISSVGALGIILLMLDERLKEISIRKALGAGIKDILLVLNKKVLSAVLIGNVVAWPLGFYLGEEWLATFAYKTSISFSVMFLAGFISLCIVILTLSYHTIKLPIQILLIP